jgi:hypothetical protein
MNCPYHALGTQFVVCQNYSDDLFVFDTGVDLGKYMNKLLKLIELDDDHRKGYQTGIIMHSFRRLSITMMEEKDIPGDWRKKRSGLNSS